MENMEKGSSYMAFFFSIKVKFVKLLQPDVSRK